MGYKQSANSAQPLSAKDYVYVALLMFAAGILLLVLFVALGPTLIRTGAFDKFYYIVLLVWGLVSGVVLFGVMRSYSQITYKKPIGGIGIELGGAAAFAALVVIGGYLLVPNATFSLTVRPHGGSGVPLITSGKIRIEFGAFASTIDVNDNGEADFKGIPHKFLGDKVKILPIISGYKHEYQEKTITGDVLDLDLETPETLVKGSILPLPVGNHTITVFADGESKPVPVDEYGNFKIWVHKNLDDDVRLSVCADGWRVYDDLQPVRHAELHLRKRDRRCNN